MKTYWQYLWNRGTIALMALTVLGFLPFVSVTIGPLTMYKNGVGPWWPWAVACGVMWTVNLLGTWIAYRKHYVPMWELGDRLIAAETELNSARKEIELSKEAVSKSYQKAVEFSDRLRELQDQRLDCQKMMTLAHKAVNEGTSWGQSLTSLIRDIQHARDLRSIKRGLKKADPAAIEKQVRELRDRALEINLPF